MLFCSEQKVCPTADGRTPTLLLTQRNHSDCKVCGCWRVLEDYTGSSIQDTAWMMTFPLRFHRKPREFPKLQMEAGRNAACTRSVSLYGLYQLCNPPYSPDLRCYGVKRTNSSAKSMLRSAGIYHRYMILKKRRVLGAWYKESFLTQTYVPQPPRKP